MTETTYPRERTALLFVDPFNDFLSAGGKVYPRIKPIADELGLLGYLRHLNGAVRAAGMQVVVVPHRRSEPGDYESWDHPNPSQQSIMKRHSFARRMAPDLATKPGDLVAHEHWGQADSPTPTSTCC
jgi:nicotinamidase-related amidase